MPHKDPAAAAANKRRYYLENKEKITARKKAYYEDNKQKALTRQKQYEADNKEEVAAAKKKWAKENRTRVRSNHKQWRENNPKKCAEYQRSYYEKNKLDISCRIRLRQLAKIQRTPIWANLDDIKGVYEQAEIMSMCNGTPHEVDHIIPLQGEFVSGLHVAANLQPIPMVENRSKGNKWLTT